MRARLLRVTVTDARGRAVDDHGLASWLACAVPARARGRVAIALVSDPEMQRLNRDYRRVDHATDVLSFPSSFDETESASAGAEGSDPPFLGDIAIAMGVARRQARAHGHDVSTELRILALHGFLHLLGYDHERDQGQMRRIEDRLRRRAGLPSSLVTNARVRHVRR